MPRAFAALMGTLTCMALGLLFFFAHQIQRPDWPYLIVLIIIAFVFDLLELDLPDGFRFSLVSAVHVAAVIIVGVPTAVWVAAVSTAAGELLCGRGPRAIAFNTSQAVVAVVAAGYAFHLLGGEVGPGFDQPLIALVAAGVYFVVNSLAVAAAFRFGLGRPFLHSLRLLLWGQPGMTYLLGQVTGLIGAYFALRREWVYLAFIVGLILLTRQAFQSYLDLYRREELRNQELTAVLNAVGSAIVLRDDRGAVRLVNRQFLRWAGLEPGADQGLDEIREDQIRSTPAGRTLLEAGATLGSPVTGGATSGVLRLALPGVRFVGYHRVPVGGGPEPAGIVEVFTDITALKEAEEQARAANESMLRALTAAIDARDPYTHGHSFHVAEYAVLIARRLGLDEADVARIRYAALLHDIGKLGIEDRVLRKHGPLTPEERAIMMQHPVIGAELLEKVGVFPELVPAVRHHHEWYNGGGYPDGLKGEEIPFDARIVAVADAFDAMTSDRPYRRALSPEEALARLQAGCNVQFDARVVAAFVAAYEAGEVEAVRERLRGIASPPPVEPEPRPVPEAGVIRPVHHRELSLLYRVARENYARLDVKQALRRILEICHDSLGQYVYMVLLTDPETGDLVVEAALGPAPELPTGLRVRPGEGPVGQAAETGRPVLVHSLAEPIAGPLPLPQTRSVCAVPLIYSGRVVGVFNVESHRPGAFSPDDQYLFEALAQQVANAVELARYHEQLAHAATHDGLTGVLNHSTFYQRLTEAVERARQERGALSLILVDLNNMKAINDTYGHLAGDQALREWAALLRANVRPQDLVARYGGDEFAVILPGASRSDARALVERLHEASTRTFQLEGRTICLPRASFGIACFPEDGERPTELVAWADHQMYAHKARSSLLLPGDRGAHVL
ncbi:MAG: diguanylate cyclase [Firmicutes bacterium]|nr:diguanylate cyclase [Bacillota bacterium]